MKKDPNNSMNGTATMPSYFPCIKSSESHPLADWLYLKSVITSSPELRMMTETYRKRLAISKQFADQYKPEMPAITVSALMNGYGRQLADFLKPTYMLQLDFDHVKKEDMEHLTSTGERRPSYDGRVYHRERQGIQSVLRLPSCG